jgi:hypothetical protein
MVAFSMCKDSKWVELMEGVDDGGAASTVNAGEQRKKK